MFHALDLFFMMPFALMLTSLFGGHASKTDRGQQLNSWGDLQKTFDFASPSGQKQITEGQGNLSSSADFFKALMSGDQTKMSQVLAPQISTIKNQETQRMNTAAQFGNRSGGTNARAQSDEEAATKSIQELFDMLGPESAKELASIGSAQEGLGTSLLNTGVSAAGTAGQQAGNTRQFDVTNESQTAQQLAQLAATLALA